MRISLYCALSLAAIAAQTTAISPETVSEGVFTEESGLLAQTETHPGHPHDHCKELQEKIAEKVDSLAIHESNKEL